MIVNVSAVSNRTMLGRLLRLPLRAVPRKWTVSVLQGPLRGARWAVASSTHGCWLGTYEPEKQEELVRRLSPGHVMYDVGANVGFHSLLASRLVGPRGRVVAFEPLPRNLAFLRRHLALNQADNVTVLEAAVSDAEGDALFDEGPHHAMGRLSAGGQLRVPTVTLDALVLAQRIPPPQLLKIDVEGAELAVLEGARHVLRAHQPAVLLATHGEAVHTACLALLRSLAYAVRPLTGSSADETDEVVAIHGET